MARPHDAADRGATTAAAPSMLGEMLAVAAGGAIGATLRGLADGLVAAADRDASPLDLLVTLAINLFGAGLLGVLLARFERFGAPPLARPFLVVGLLGAFTTYSTLIEQLAGLWRSSGPLPATAHLFFSLALGLASFGAGQRLGGHPRRRRGP